ncbi:phosphatase PAP2 family protein [Emcibacter sp.]|uniref:phosphatase PAP2 family protein n=1 Tax=Emcibacter sp. TaxID=1979954 RepID=UPI002AA8D44A|nr:phosphatase PAP2 family protein [Emcibacter sp.]
MVEAVLAKFNIRLDLDQENLARHQLLLVIFLLQALTVWGLLTFNGLSDSLSLSLYAGPMYMALGAIIFAKIVSYLVRFSAYEKEVRNKSRLVADFRESWLNSDYLLAFLVPILFLPPFISLFSSLKTVIPEIQPFGLDQTFASLDRWLHFGFDPWVITHTLFSGALAAGILDFCYKLWFVLMFVFVLWQVVNVSLGHKRAQFLCAFLLVWFVLGNLMAVMMSSAGPCYYAVVLPGNDFYAPLMDRLGLYYDELKAGGGFFQLQTRDLQQQLLAYYQNGAMGMGSGISAMPSLHVAVAMLLYLSAREMNRFAGFFFLGFLLVIQVGSVHLGWHYAVDGYFSIIATWLIWNFSGWLVGYYAKAKGAKAA